MNDYFNIGYDKLIQSCMHMHANMKLNMVHIKILGKKNNLLTTHKSFTQGLIMQA